MDKTPYLEWSRVDGDLQRIEIVDKVFLGRSCKGVDEAKRIIVVHPLVSRDHAVISTSGRGFEITDMSKNGTWVNGVRVGAGSTQELSDGDEIRLGDALIRVHSGSGPERNVRDTLGTAHTMITPMNAVVTHLVADVRGFSSMAQSQSSGDIYALMREIFDGFSGVVRAERGTIKDYAGDAVYAFWDHGETPVPGPATSACRAALRQAESVDGICAKLAGNPAVAELQLGWGIATGKVTVSHYGSQVPALALVGDSTNLAFRLSSMANKDVADGIVLCETTAGLVRKALAVTDLGEVDVRGRKGRERVFTVARGT